MRTLLRLTLALAGAAVGAACAFVAVQAGRHRVRQGLERAETIVEQTRATLDQTESTLRTVHDAI